MDEFFKGIKVVELAGILAGPAVGAFFSELGASVIKFENERTGGDATRHWRIKGESDSNEFSAYYASVNIGKERRIVDFSKADDLESVYEEIKDADVLLSNTRPADALKYKLDYDSLRQVNPSLIYGLITGFHGSNRPAFDVVLQAECGLMSINGEPEGLPLKLPVAFIDQFAAHQLKEGILLAMMKKNATGMGSLVTVSLYDAAVSSLANQASNYLMTGRIPEKTGSLHPNIAPYGEIFKTEDGKYLVLAIGTDSQFEKMMNVLGIRVEKDFQTNPERVRNRKALAGKLESAICRLDSNFLSAEFDKHDVPFGIIRSIDEVMDNSLSAALVKSESKGQEVLKGPRSNVFRIK